MIVKGNKITNELWQGLLFLPIEGIVDSKRARRLWLNLDDALRLLDEIQQKPAAAEEFIDDGHESNSDPGPG